ncbi:molecular chaperone [Mesomycoplasma conjunctivae]|uniref:Gcp-like domain-containing protein n=1 Tax=Mesomycoplasma conjunctivae (strain ATCC 25834 / NCTC 10147 / HRC/581) TaxID=572263 RepID=C5J7B2_MESCH|nr:hypothetical protein [Mesomycoplasma conjunctivae]CAT05375.1 HYPOTHETICAL PROTEIN MCJ_006810 [Mesomycoplasma conjunctivae]VEU66601.1 molecular chaperone [Mesomycoplasma conjunctivae]
MKFFIDTTGQDLALAIFDENYFLIDFLVETVFNKADLLPSYVKKILNKNSLKINQIQDFYLNLGPGMFTGCRVALVFTRTIAQLNKVNIYTTNSFALSSFLNKNEDIYYISTSSKYAFQASAKNGKITSKISEVNNPSLKASKIDYFLIFNSFYLASLIFKKELNFLKIKPLYIKEPTIG